MTKKELNENRKALRLQFENLSGQFDDCCYGAWREMAEKNLNVPRGESPLEPTRKTYYRTPQKFSQRSWFQFTELMQQQARKHLYPVTRWMEMIMVIDFHYMHYSYHQKQWKKAVTPRQMNAHNKVTERIVDSMRQNLQLLIQDRIAWQAIK